MPSFFVGARNRRFAGSFRYIAAHLCPQQGRHFSSRPSGRFSFLAALLRSDCREPGWPLLEFEPTGAFRRTRYARLA